MTSIAVAPVPGIEPARNRLIMLALATGSFAIGLSEFASMALVTDIADGLGITEPQVGHAISAYALGVVVGAPVLALIGARFARKYLLIGLMLAYALGNLASAFAPGYHGLLLFRFVSGLPHGAYFGVAALVAASLCRPEDRGKAVSRVLLGLSVAIMIGNPFASWVGETAGWRPVYGLVAGLALLTGVLVAALLPYTRPEPAASPWAELRAFNRSQVWFALAIGAVGFAGMFSVFAYLVPTLIHVSGVDGYWIQLALAVFGLGCIVGNLTGGWLFDRIGFRSVFWVLVWILAVLLLFPSLIQSPVWMLPAVLLAGTISALSPALQTRLMDVAADAQTLAAASNHASFNTANALGPWLAGMAITAGFGWTSAGYVGATTAALALGIYGLARWDERRRKSSPAIVTDAA